MTTTTSIPDLDSARRATYYTTIVLREGRSGDFQLVFASQVYGTFFGIYAKLDFTKLSGRLKLNKITFRIINYKGQINIGIDSVDAPLYHPEDHRKLNIIFHLKGYMPPLQDYECDFTQDEIYLEDGSEITFKRNMRDFVADTNHLFEDGAFDSEFYFRDGLFPIEAPVAALEKEIERRYPSDQTIGKRCPWSIVRVSESESWPS
jgi:hypothetical protein